MEPLRSLTFHGKSELTIHKGRCLNPDSSSSVFLGWDSTAADHVVIKEFNLDEFDCSLENTGKHKINREDLENEYLRFIDLTHPNLVKLLGFNFQLENKRVYLLTEYVEGKSLRSMIEQKKWLPMKQVQEYAVQILQALACLHSKNIHHPSLDLDNVLIDIKEQVKVINFYSGATIWKYIRRTSGNLKRRVETSKDVQQLGGMLLSMCKNCDGVGREFFDLPSELQNFLQMCNTKESTVSQLLEHAFIKCGTDVGLISSDWKMMNSMFLKEDPGDQDEEDEEDEMEEDDDELNDPDDTVTENEEDFDDLECDGVSTTDKWSPRLQIDFKILGLLGKGAYGEVIKVQNRIDERCCAIKIIPLSITETGSSDGSSSEETSRTETEKERSVLSETQQNLIMRNQIMREVQHLSKMNHENVVRYFNTWIETCEMDTELKMSGDDLKTISLKSGKEYMFIHMELCENNTLRNSIDEELCSNQQLVWKLFKEILLGLDHIHKLGIIHRDLKPENIFLSSENHVKIGDFGLARGLNMNDVFVHSELPDNHVDNVNNLTMNIGTSYYVSPEVKSKTTYDQKADIYSLGVIFFEMSYRPMPTGMERHKILNSLCQEKITLPDDFEKYGTSKQKTMIKLLLSHDPTARQTASELLKNENICEKVDESELSNAQPNNWSNVKAVDVLFQNLKCVNSEDTYGSRSVVLFSKEQHLLLSSIERIFRKHGAREINVPLLVPKSPIYENIGFDQVLLNCHGKMLVLSKDYRIAFAHFLAYYMKSQETAKYYSISCRENRYYRFCDYDLEASVDFINVPCGMVVLYQTELMCIVKEILKNGPGSCDLIFRVNHTSLLQALLNFYQVPEENLEDILFWYEYYTKKEIVVTPLSVKSHFDHLNIGDRFDQLFELLAMEDSFGSVQDYLLGIFKNGCENESLVKNVSIAKNALEEIGLLVDMLKMTGSRIKVKLALGLLIDSKCYSGLVFQVVSKSESGNLHVLARGGQYDKLFNSFCCDGRSEISAQKHAVGVTIDINHIKIVSSVLNSLPHVMVFSRSKKYHAKDEIIVASRLLKIGFPAIMYDGAIHGGSIMGATKFCADNFINLLVLMRSRKDSNITITSIPDNKVIKDGCSIKEMFEFFEMLERRYDSSAW